MTLVALCHPLVQPQEWPFGVVSVIKSNRRPAPRLVAPIALIAQASEVQRVVVTTHAALRWRLIELVVRMTLPALHALVVRNQWPVALLGVNVDVGISNLDSPQIMALEAGLDSLAIAHHFLTLWFVGELAVVDVLVLVTSQAGLALVGRG